MTVSRLYIFYANAVQYAKSKEMQLKAIMAASQAKGLSNIEYRMICEIAAIV